MCATVHAESREYVEAMIRWCASFSLQCRRSTKQTSPTAPQHPSAALDFRSLPREQQPTFAIHPDRDPHQSPAPPQVKPIHPPAHPASPYDPARRPIVVLIDRMASSDAPARLLPFLQELLEKCRAPHRGIDLQPVAHVPAQRGWAHGCSWPTSRRSHWSTRIWPSGP